MPFERVDVDEEVLEGVRKDITALYRDFCEGRLLVEYDFELEEQARKEQEWEEESRKADEEMRETGGYIMDVAGMDLLDAAQNVAEAKVEFECSQRGIKCYKGKGEFTVRASEMYEAFFDEEVDRLKSLRREGVEL